MFVYGADFFLVKPGIVLLVMGLLLTLPLTFGQATIGPITFSLHWSIAGVALAVLGLQSFYLGTLSRIFYETDGAIRRRWLRRLRYNRAVVVSAVLFVVGVALTSSLIWEYVANDLRLPNDVLKSSSYRAVTGVLLMIMGFMTFTFTLVVHAYDLVSLQRSRSLSPSPESVVES
jgi:hypothetical protein